MFRQSWKKLSGKPLDLPIQSGPVSEASEALRFVGPMAIGVVAPGVLSPPEANVEAVAGDMLSQGKMLLSRILLVINFSTNSMYLLAGRRFG